MSVRPTHVLDLLRANWPYAAVVVAVVALGWGYQSFYTPQKRVVRARLSEADDRSKASIDTQLKPLNELFAKGRKGAKVFAQEALSWNGKWALVKGLADNGQSHHRFLAELFVRHVFGPEDLRQAMESAVKMYLADLEGHEAEMLVRLRADLANLDPGGDAGPGNPQGDESFQAEYRKLAGQVVSELHLDIGVTVGRELGLMVASDLVTQIALQAARAAAADMGVSAGVLGSGAASTVATLGLGMVLAFILDAILDEVFKMAGYDPAAKIEALVIESINKMEAALIRDTGWISFHNKGALRERLEQLHEARSRLRRETITRFLKEGGMR